MQKQAQVTHVYYPGIPGTRDYEIATAEAKGYGGVLSFELRQDLDAQRFVEKLKLIKLAVSLGAVESLIELPAKMTHAELSPPKEQLAVGITPQLVRLAVGIEDPRDLIADLAQALGNRSKNT